MIATNWLIFDKMWFKPTISKLCRATCQMIFVRLQRSYTVTFLFLVKNMIARTADNFFSKFNFCRVKKFLVIQILNNII